MNELGLSRYLGASFVLRHHKKYAPIRSAIMTKGMITAAAMTPPLTEDFFAGLPVAVALELDDDDEVVVVVVLAAVVVAEVVVVVAAVVFGWKVTAVKTICNFTSAAWPVNVVSTVVASDEAPHAHAEY